MMLHGVTRCYMVLHGFTWCYAVLYGVTRCYMVLDVLHLFLIKASQLC